MHHCIELYYGMFIRLLGHFLNQNLNHSEIIHPNKEIIGLPLTAIEEGLASGVCSCVCVLCLHIHLSVAVCPPVVGNLQRITLSKLGSEHWN